MKKNIIILFLVPFFFSSCEKRKFEFDLSLNLEETYIVDHTGNFSESQTITRSDVMDALSIPENAEIESVSIESIAISIQVLNDNEASALLVSGMAQLGNGSPQIFNNFPISLVGVDIPFVGINSLIADGVEGIKDKIEGYIKGTDSAPFSIEISGDSSPTAGQRVHVQILIQVKGNVKYTNCEDALPFMGADCS
ncbi:MAG: hypothetical protein JXJ22_03345 [Bacteroidales bacterium]|nr:hypothetical protein [Bacteroidales bacterium]